MKVKVISLPYIFQVLYVLCFTRPRYQVSVYRTIGPLVCPSDKLCLIFPVFHILLTDYLEHMPETVLVKCVKDFCDKNLNWLSSLIIFGHKID